MAFLALALVLVIVGFRMWDAWRGPPLQPWHVFVPDDVTADAIDRLDWQGYLAAEARLFESVRQKAMLEPAEAVGIGTSRYVRGSPVDPGGFSQDWNRSYTLDPVGPAAGAVVLLHGLTDSPYSLRHFAERYREHGFAVVAIRLPGHGTVPSGLTTASSEDWTAATRLAVKEARRRAGEGRPIHIVGFSNGGALALIYALETLGDSRLPKVDRIVLISPMVGITRFARFAGIAGLPAFFPSFAKAAWLAVLPEFNPFKYNSFPVNGARQSYRLTQELRAKLAARQRDGGLRAMPPVLTFQSVLDFTVSTRAIITGLYNRLPSNGSALVLFDLNRNAKLGPLLSTASETMLSRLLPPPPRLYETTIVTNAGPGRSDVVAQTTQAGANGTTSQDLGLTYPSEVFSLSHVALPFPVTDALYGKEPDEDEDFGIRLGTVAARGETGALIVRLDNLLRMSSNPFFPYEMERIEAFALNGEPRLWSGASDGALPTPSEADSDGDDVEWLERAEELEEAPMASIP